MQTRDLFSD